MDVRTTDPKAGASSLNGRRPNAPAVSTPRIVSEREASGSAGHLSTNRRTATPSMRTEAAMRRLNLLLELQSARIAGLLHDEASQFLASAHMAIADIARDAPAPLQARLQEVRADLGEVAEQLRRISLELHPRILDDLGLSDAIRFIARAFTHRTGIQLNMAIEAQLDELCAATVGPVVYRFVQEALANIEEHAQATSSSIEIARDRSRLLCVVCDDGTGFDADATLARNANTSLGLIVIRDRLEAAGATLEITSAPKRGTQLRAILPLEL